MNAIILARAGEISHHGRLFLGEFARSAYEHRFLHAFALTALFVAIVVGHVTHVKPDIATVESFGANLAVVFLYAGAFAAIAALLWLALVERNRTPALAFARFFASYLGDAAWVAGAVNALLVATVFSLAFGGLKGAIAVIAPFSWDRSLAHLDKLLAFGHDPYTWLWPLVQSPLAVGIANFLYNAWFFVLLSSFLAAACTRRGLLRHQYLMAFMGTWFVGGFLIAMAVSSAGPCYFNRLGLGHEFNPLMSTLRAIGKTHAMWSWTLATQNTLWAGYSGARAGSVGISAFPSMHVATAVLVALFASATDRRLGIAMWAFAALIFASSIMLGWHYAVDGYASVVIALTFWKLSGLYARRHLATASAA